MINESYYSGCCEGAGSTTMSEWLMEFQIIAVTDSTDQFLSALS